MKILKTLMKINLLNKLKLRKLIKVAVLFTVVELLLFTVFKPSQVKAAWFDDAYQYRQKFSFTHNADITTERAVTFSLDTAELITAGVMQSDCDDTRFTDLNGKVLRYQLTGTCNNAATTYEVVFPSIINGTNYGFVYYGNSLAVSESASVSGITALTPSGGDPAITTRTSEEKGPSPVLYLKFDEGYGTNTNDSSSNNNDGSISGAAWKTRDLCLSENCLFYDGTDDVVTITNADSLDFDNGLISQVTFQGWVRVNSDGENSVGQIFNKGTNTYLRITNEGTDGLADLEASLDLATTDATVTITNGIELNKWTHVALTYTDDADDEITVYINGLNKSASTNGSGAPATDANDLLLGGPSTANYHGFIDEFKIYAKERSVAEVKTDYIKGSSLHGASSVLGIKDESYLSDGLSAYWKLDEAATPAIDSSGNGNSGTWSGNVAAGTGKFSNAADFDGSEDVITTSSSVSISPTSGLTVTGWMKMDSTFSDTSNNYNQGLVDKGDYSFFLDKSDGKAKWVVNDATAAAFSALGSVDQRVETIVVWNGSLYIGGSFLNAGGDADADYIAKWDGTSFSWPTGQGLDYTVNTLSVWNGNLYVGGGFNNAGGDADADYIAKWDGTSFSWPTGQGLSSTSIEMAVWNGNLYVGGQFTDAGGDADADGIAKWDGTSFSWPTGQGLSSSVSALTVWNNNLYVSGFFLNAGGDADADYIAKWDGTSFSWPTGQTLNFNAADMAVWNGNLYIAGQFTNAGGDADADYIAKWDGTSFSWPTGQGLNTTADNLVVWNGNLYIGGKFTDAGGDADADYIAKWDGTSFSWPNGQGLNPGNEVATLTIWNGDLYVGGIMTNVGGDANADYIVKWGTSATKAVSTTISSWTATTWYHFAGTYDGTNMKIYINGIQEASVTSVPTSLGSQSLSLLMGKTYGSQMDGGSGEELAGQLDDMRIYNRALSPAEISSLYNWAPGPVGYWKLDEASGIRYDSSTYSNNLTDSNSVKSAPGKFGFASDHENNPVDGNQSLTITDALQNKLDITSNLSTEAWIKLESTGVMYSIASKDGTTGNSGYSLRVRAAGQAQLQLSNDGTTQTVINGNTVLSTDTWYHVAAVYDGSNLYLYLNGISDATPVAYSSGIFDSTAEFSVGGRGNAGTTDEFDGLLDDVRVYNYPRTQRQIVEDMNAGHPAPGSPIGSAVAHWKFDEGALNTCSGGTNDFCDSSVNVNDLAYSTTTGGITNSGKFGKAFSGATNTRASRTDDADLDFAATEGLTASIWFKRDTVSAVEYLIYKENGNEGYTVYMDSDGDIVFGIGDTNSTSFPEESIGGSLAKNYDDNAWHNAVAVKNGTTSIRLYVDGKEIASDTSLIVDATLENAGTFYLADANATDGTDEFLGTIDDVKIFRSALTAEQIKVLYNQSSSSVWGASSTNTSGIADNSSDRSYCPPGDTTASCSPVAEWKMDEISSPSQDTSGNGNSGTWGGNVASTIGKIGNAADFDGNEDVITTASSVSISPTSGLTVEGWVRMDSAFSGSSDYHQGLVDKGDYQFYLDKSDGKAKWVVNDATAAAFSALSTGISAASIKSLTVWNGNLYIGGAFINAGGDADADNIAKWDGSTFSWPTGQGLDNAVTVMTVWNGNLYIGGAFINAGGDADADGMAKWDGTSFSWPTGQGLDAPTIIVNILAVWNGSLYVGGDFTNAGGDADADSIAKWDGTSFSWPTGQGLAAGAEIHTMTVWNGYLYISGAFSDAGGDADADGIAKWDGSSFSWPTGQGLSGISRLIVWNGNLYLGGDFTDAGGDLDADKMAKWDGTSFSWPTGQGLSGGVDELAIWDGNLYVGGLFTNAGGDADADGIAKWGTTATKAVSSTTSSWIATTWYHVAGTYDGSSMKIYINGIQEGSVTSVPSSLGSQSLSLLMGKTFGSQMTGGSGEELAGQLDEMRIYNYARTPSQIAWDYNRGVPMAHYKFDECQSTTAYDSATKADPSASRYDGTIIPGASGNTTAGSCGSGISTEMWNDGTSGKLNSALGFDGADDYVQVSDTANLRFDDSAVDFSLFTWVKRTTTGAEYIISKEDADDDGWRLMFNSSNQVLCSEDATDVASTQTITDTNWHHIGCTIDRDGNGQIYIDGKANGSAVSMGSDAMATTANIRIGTRSYTSTSYFNGLIDDLRIYNYVLTMQQIKTMMNEGAVRFGPETGSP